MCREVAEVNEDPKGISESLICPVVAILFQWLNYCCDSLEKRLKLSAPVGSQFLAPFKAGTHEGACSCNTLPQHAPGAKLPRLYQQFHAKKLLRNKVFAPGFCSIESNWLNMREQAPGANLLQEQAPSCVSAFRYLAINWRWRTKLQQAESSIW